MQTLYHPVVFALFRAELRVIDHAKRASLSHLLLENVTSTAPGEKLDEKLASLTFTTGDPDCTSSSAKHWLCLTRCYLSIVPPPSSETEAWWDGPG